MLEFCSYCRNLLYITVLNNKFIKECKYCCNEIEENNKSKKILETNYITNNILYQKYYAEFNDKGIPINKLLASDPTLPRIIDINIKPPDGYEHDINTPVSYIKQIDQTFLWISNTTGEIWH